MKYLNNESRTEVRNSLAGHINNRILKFIKWINRISMRLFNLSFNRTFPLQTTQHIEVHGESFIDAFQLINVRIPLIYYLALQQQLYRDMSGFVPKQKTVADNDSKPKVVSRMLDNLDIFQPTT